MPDVLLLGATGYTGRLTAHALAAQGADFAISGRNEAKLKALAEMTGEPEVRVAEVADVSSIVRALGDVKVLLTCVGPFMELGWTALEAAVKARVHYIDSTGEAAFIEQMIARWDSAARNAGIALAPAMGFDEVPADVAATLATEGLDKPDLVLTYALPSQASLGTLRSALGIAASKGPWIEDGHAVMVGAGEHHRWAPMPPPLGPKHAISFPFAFGRLAPLHLSVRSLKLYSTADTARRIALTAALPALRTLHKASWDDDLLGRVAGVIQRREGPRKDQRERSKWTILAEARSGEHWRNVALSGVDPYGLTAELLARSSMEMARPGYDPSGTVAPVQAVGLDFLEKQLADLGSSIVTYGPK